MIVEARAAARIIRLEEEEQEQEDRAGSWPA
jgi:hypothetical protein